MSARSAGAMAAAAGLAALSLACRGSGASDDRGDPQREARGSSLPEQSQPFVRFPAAGVPASTPQRERGLGVVHLDPGPRLAGLAADTLSVRAAADPLAPTLARLVLDTTGVFTFEARDGLVAAPGALEFGYEEVGLAVLERGTEGWERVYLGSARDGAPVSGWVRAEPGRVGVTLWEELLPGQPLFFVVPADSFRFHEAPGGAERAFPVAPDEYILWPLETRGDWMRVRAVSPSDYCAEPSSPREDTLWIRWLSEGGRPRVWFYTRGC